MPSYMIKLMPDYAGVPLEPLDRPNCISLHPPSHTDCPHRWDPLYLYLYFYFFHSYLFFPSYSISILLYFCFPCSSPQCKHKAENLGHAMGHNFFYVALLAQQSLQFVSLISIYMMFNVHHTECCLNEIILTISL